MRKTYVPYRRLVIYHNKFNLVSLKDLDNLENNLLFSIFNQMKYDDSEFFFRLDELKGMIGGNKNLTNIEVINKLESLKSKFFGLYFDIILPRRDITTNLFSQMIIEYTIDNKIFKGLTIKLNVDAIDIFQKLKKEFTSFDLQIFKKLKSKYSKSLFRLLSQYSSLGKYQCNYQWLREYLGVPTNYDYKTFNFQILTPSVKELSNQFKKLNVEVTRYRENNKVIHKDIIFSFIPFQNSSSEKIEILYKDKNKKALFALRVASNELNKIANSKALANKDYSKEQEAVKMIDTIRYTKAQYN